MTGRTRMIACAAAVLLGLSMGAVSVSAKPEFSKKEKKACTVCHVKIGAKDLNDVGKCYKDSKFSLDTCEAKPESK